MEAKEIKAIIIRELPAIMQSDPEVRQFILNLTSDRFADKVQTEGRFEEMLADLRRAREEDGLRWRAQAAEWRANHEKWKVHEEETRQERLARQAEWQALMEERRLERLADEEKWKAHEEETRRERLADEEKWKAQAAAWQANHEKWKIHEEETRQERLANEERWKANQATLDKMIQRIDSGIGALGARWGIQAESSFRNGLAAILESSFGVQVINYVDRDEAGEVFGRPDQVELDVIIKDGQLIICEIKSSMSKSDMYTFDRKARFYERRHGRTANRRLVISPMVDARAQRVAQELGIEVYSYADENLALCVNH